MCQHLPEEYEARLLSFYKFIVKKHSKHEYLLSPIGNADQTPVLFDAPKNMTVGLKGKKSIHVLTTRAEKQQHTVILCITADDCKLPFYVVFKKKCLPTERFVMMRYSLGHKEKVDD